ncbi:MAG: 30S ribosomal protein S9 [Opitutales bacterium]|jgi:small subunit ribosomal protein S9|nr:30S ribosomal protein S9 [Opitutales bacterium]MDP4659433.1 30S ribosomal protein S9 [Opitutales bacterium]MDP4774939.1 30S ribosomal protein S9 [Opitutales bacterium]MDP4787908.1 30S ribosomal protein S9 [Opitutales bacterium]MDP4861552.1 30S ribosomal protein S9 [Opitutales bacterium]
MSAKSSAILAVGRRKTASARVRLSRGTGVIVVNGKPVEEYLYTEALVKSATLPITTAGLDGQLDVVVRVIGGGPNGQAGAISHGLARAIQKMDATLRAPLKKEGLLTRDGRMRERKKPGRPGARKRFQFSKR